MVRRGVAPYLFVLNNDGYEIERLSECVPEDEVSGGDKRLGLGGGSKRPGSLGNGDNRRALSLPWKPALEASLGSHHGG